MKKYLLILCIILPALSCDTENIASSKALKCNSEQEFQEVTNTVVETIRIKNDSLVGLYSKTSIIEDDNQEYLLGTNLMLNRIEMFNLSTGEYEKTIKTNTPLELNQSPLMEAQIISLDSIVLFGFGGRMVIMNEAEETIDHWDFSKLITPSDTLSGVGALNNSESFFFQNNSVYIRAQPPFNWDQNVEFYKSPFMIEFDFRKDKVISYLGKFPELITSDSKYYFYNDYKFSWIQSAQNPYQLIISYRRSDCLQIFDLKTEEILYISAKSKYLNEFELIPRNGESQDVRKILVTQGTYQNLLYDKFRNVYYRIVSHSQPFKNEQTDSVNNAAIRPFSIIILDENLRYLGETVIDKYEKYSYANPTISTKGILFPVYDNDENVVTFDIISVDLEELKP